MRIITIMVCFIASLLVGCATGVDMHQKTEYQPDGNGGGQTRNLTDINRRGWFGTSSNDRLETDSATRPTANGGLVTENNVHQSSSGFALGAPGVLVGGAVSGYGGNAYYQRPCQKVWVPNPNIPGSGRLATLCD